MKIIILFSIVLQIPVQLYSQSGEKRNKSVFVEARGVHGFYTVNFDMILYKISPVSFSFRTGASLLPNNDVKFFNGKRSYIMTFPLLINILIGKNADHLEMGGGLTWDNRVHRLSLPSGDEYLERSTYESYSLFIGYRYQRQIGGLMLRTGIYLIEDRDMGQLEDEYFSIGVGYTF